MSAKDAKDAKFAKNTHPKSPFAPLAFFADGYGTPSVHRDVQENSGPRRARSSRRIPTPRALSRPWRSLQTALALHPLIVTSRKTQVREGREVREGHSFRMSLRALGALYGRLWHSIRSSRCPGKLRFAKDAKLAKNTHPKSPFAPLAFFADGSGTPSNHSARPAHMISQLAATVPSTSASASNRPMPRSMRLSVTLSCSWSPGTTIRLKRALSTLTR